MKLTILQDDAIAEDEIIIRTATRHPCLERLIDLFIFIYLIQHILWYVCSPRAIELP